MVLIKIFMDLLKSHPVKQNNYKDTMKIQTNNFCLIIGSREVDACAVVGVVEIFRACAFGACSVSSSRSINGVF